MNLLQNKHIHTLFKAWWFPVVPQIVMLGVFIALIWGGLGVTSKDAACLVWLRNTNLSNLIVWSTWWPVIIITAVVLGRVWCMVCPMELLTYGASRIGLRLPVPRFIKSGWGVTIFYTLIWVVGMQVLGINRIPHHMALYMLLLIIVAVDVSLIFRKRAFCSYVCPVGHLLGLYAMLSPFELRADNTPVCRGCKSKACVNKRNQTKLTGRSCTSQLYPATIRDNRDCLLCTQCVKVCPNDNIRVSFRRPFTDVFNDLDLRPAQVAFILMLSGFVAFEIFSEWTVSYDMMMWVPDRVTQALGMSGTTGQLVGVTVMFVFLPIIVLWAISVLAKVVSGWKAAPFRDTTKAFTLILLPTIASAHILKSLLKIISRIPYWTGALADPRGIETTEQLATESVVLDKSIIHTFDPWINTAAIVLLGGALISTLWIYRRSTTIKKLNPGVRWVVLTGFLAYWGLFGLMIYQWRF